MIIPSSVTEIGKCAFEFCSGLKSVKLSSSLTKINFGTFSKCTSLTTAEIPESVQEIGEYAFSGCNKLKTIEMSAKVNLDDYYLILPFTMDFEYYSVKTDRSIFSAEELDLPKDEFVKFRLADRTFKYFRLKKIKEAKEKYIQSISVEVYDKETQEQIKNLEKIIERAKAVICNTEQKIFKLKSKNNNSND